jgi:hypothetical protein
VLVLGSIPSFSLSAHAVPAVPAFADGSASGNGDEDSAILAGRAASLIMIRKIYSGGALADCAVFLGVLVRAPYSAPNTA